MIQELKQKILQELAKGDRASSELMMLSPEKEPVFWTCIYSLQNEKRIEPIIEGGVLRYKAN